jgi:hypothetical protein
MLYKIYKMQHISLNLENQEIINKVNMFYVKIKNVFSFDVFL